MALTEKTRLINIRHTSRFPNFTIYIGRKCNLGGWALKASKWANPFPISHTCSREESLKKFEEYILSHPTLLNELDELEGHILGCWCKPLPCHGDILLSLLKKKKAEQINRLLN